MANDQIYQPLDSFSKEIRVLVLEPGPRDAYDILKGTLVRTTLDPLPITEVSNELDYETISYAWGDGSLQTMIVLDGHIVDVPQSSEAALRRMRLEDRKRNLWIDAICINQDDLVERAAQVAMMGEVFSNGTCNLIHLGEDDDLIEEALGSVRLLLDTEVGEATRNGRSILDTTKDNNGESLSSRIPISVGIDPVALAILYSKPWFSRLWVVQEVAMARNNRCFCGAYSFDLVEVLLVATWLNYKYISLPRGSLRDTFKERHAVKIFNCMRTPHSTILHRGWTHERHRYLLYLAKSFETSNPLDKVFAVLGLFSPRERAQMRDFSVDYAMSLADVLTQAWACAFSAARNPLYMLGFSHRSNEDVHVEGLPSWVPRSHRKGDSPLEASRFPYIYKASLYVRSHPLFVLPPRGSGIFGSFGRMTVQGFLIDDVSETFLPEHPRENFYIENLKDDYLLPLQRLISKSICVDDTAIYLLTAGAWHDGTAITSSQIDACKRLVFKVLEENYQPRWLQTLDSDADSETRLMSQCMQTCFQACACRAICETRRNLLVLGPKIAQNGDIVVQLLGMPTPCVLRPCGELFECIGPAYVHGVMHGEALEEWQDAGGIAETYTLI